MVSFDLFLDESGSFDDQSIDPSRPTETSLVGGLLAPLNKITEDYKLALLPYPVHCCNAYKKYYLDALEAVKKDRARFVVFENKERLKVINGDITYLNIISEGLVKLFRDLSNENMGGVFIRVTIATRKAMNARSGIIKYDEYTTRLEEKIQLALGRNHVMGCTYSVQFKDARFYNQLDFADIICNTWFTRRRSKKFSDYEQRRIEELYQGQFIYPVFEDALTVYIKQLLLERHYGEAMFQICALPKITGFATLRKRIVHEIEQADSYEQDIMFSQMSLMIGQYNRLKSFAEGIKLAENYEKYFLDIINTSTRHLERIIPYWRFDTNFYLVTMYDHVGNTSKCQEHLSACKADILSVNRSWEHIDYYFSFCIRELNVLMGRFAFCEVIQKADELIKIFTEAKELFGMIKTYNNTEQTVKSELLGKVYGVKLEAIINLLRQQPELEYEAIDISNKALTEFNDARDISRQYQWRCLLMVEAKKPTNAYIYLLRAADVEVGEEAIQTFLQKTYAMKTGYEFLIWHYTNVMLLMKEHDDPLGDKMADALFSTLQFKDDVKKQSKSEHPWNLVLWNIGKYYRLVNYYSTYKNLYERALKITMQNKENITMMTFALSMSADRLLWSRKNKLSDQEKMETDFRAICKTFSKTKATTEMKMWFLLDRLGNNNASNEILQELSYKYLK